MLQAANNRIDSQYFGSDLGFTNIIDRADDRIFE
jgi:hypothetical protein